MKKLAFSLIACLALSQSAFAAVAPLSESLLTYEAIINAIGTDSDFNPTEFVVDIKRITQDLDTFGTVKYRIVTRTVGLDDSDDSSHYSCSSPSRHETKNYIATLQISPNPGIGPNIIEVISIELSQHHNH